MARPHEILGIARGAPESEVRAAFRRLAAKHHPDREGGDARQFRRARLAYEAMLASTPNFIEDIINDIAQRS